MTDAPEEAADSRSQQQVGARLRELRAARGLSQRELARRAGMTNANLSMIEQGRVSPSIQTLEKILRAVPMSLADFFLAEGPAEPFISKRAAQSQLLGKGADAYVCLTPAHGASLFLLHQYLAPGATLTEFPLVVQQNQLAAVVVQGTVTLALGDKSWQLEQGDAFQLHPQRRFRLENAADQQAILVLVMTPKEHDTDNKV